MEGQHNGRVLKPVQIGENFPGYKIAIFGEACEIAGESKTPGYALVRVSFPHQTEVLAFGLGDTKLGESYVPSNVPDIGRVRLKFGEPYDLARSHLLNPLRAEHPEMDIFEVRGGEVVWFRRGEESPIQNTNVLLQVFDFYSRFLRKTHQALKKTDNSAARGALVWIIKEMRDTSPFDIKRFADLEKRMRDAFISFSKAVLSEVI
jgi:hypothetical protein